MKKANPRITLLLQLLSESYEKKAWHGTNLRGSIRGLTHSEAAWRPGRGRHNIWEIVVHCAYWKHIVRRRILDEKKGSFPLKGSNWFSRPDVNTEEAWRADIRLLKDTHVRLLETVRTLRDADLSLTPRGSTVPNDSILTGIASHDVYHAGQTQLIKRLMK